jgi:endonuclease YncB( thermonuclease family)
MYMLGMKKILLLILLLCWPLTAHAWMAKVVSVTDGDTIKVYNAEQGQVKIRLYGIDTPEKAQPYGKAAGKYLSSLIAGATVDIESVTTDRYGRTVGIVSDSERNINQQMVRAGYAWVYQRYCDKPFCDYWLALESEAKTDKLGLWQESNPVPPWEWRRRK